MIEVVETNSSNKDFIDLVTKLDEDLEIRDGDEHSFYAQFNTIDVIKYVIILYFENIPVACGAIKHFDEDTMEVKRMYVLDDFRGKGFATKVLIALEKWAINLKCKKLILETGKKQPEAIRLYGKNGFSIIPNYGQYIGIDNSICFKKEI